MGYVFPTNICTILRASFTYPVYDPNIMETLNIKNSFMTLTLYSSFVATTLLGLKLLPKHSLGNIAHVPYSYETTHKAT
jgi:hypothetical protein